VFDHTRALVIGFSSLTGILSIYATCHNAIWERKARRQIGNLGAGSWKMLNRPKIFNAVSRAYHGYILSPYNTYSISICYTPSTIHSTFYRSFYSVIVVQRDLSLHAHHEHTWIQAIQAWQPKMTILVLSRCHRYAVNWLRRILVQWPFVHFPKYAYSLTVAPQKDMLQLYTTSKICWSGPRALLPAPCPSYIKSSPRDDVVGGDLAADSLNRYSNLWNWAYMLACVYWPCRWWTCSYFPKSMSTLVRSKYHWGLMMSTWSCNCFVWSVHGHACSSLQVALFLASAFKKLSSYATVLSSTLCKCPLRNKSLHSYQWAG